MQRNLTALADREFDVLVVGGGAAGAAAAREAGLRGLTTALIEREDFGAGSSAQCFKVVHGGIRYLQHADIGRLRASCRERSIFLRIAPHLVAPLPFAIPTYGHGRSGKALLRIGMTAYDMLTADRNRRLPDPLRRIASARFLGREETLRSFPLLERDGLTGAAVFEDGQMYNPPRLVLAFIAAAGELGAVVANHVEAERLLVDGSRVMGVRARDRLSGEAFDIRARVTVNAAGPWAEGLLATLGSTGRSTSFGGSGTYSRDACFVVAREPLPMALAIQGATRDQDALLARATRHLFMVPWRGHTLVGVWHTVVPRDPDGVRLAHDELTRYVEEINEAHPALRLDPSEVREVCYGLVPFGDAARQQAGALSFGKESRIVDHRYSAIAGGRRLEGLVSAISVRYTVARRDAVAALDLACSQLDRAGSDSIGTSSRTRARRQTDAGIGLSSELRPLAGGDIEDFAGFSRELETRSPPALPAATLHALGRNHGTRAARVLALAAAEPALARCVSGTSVLAAEVAYAVRAEMAQRLADVVFRRTELGTAGHPGERAIAEALDIMRGECGWSAQRAADERAATDRHFARYLAAPPTTAAAPATAAPRDPAILRRA
ncbi:MAG: glycerol-3-phosphate dehydrogenase/oxidase [Steroidobacteraceae bacterium]